MTAFGRCFWGFLVLRSLLALVVVLLLAAAAGGVYWKMVEEPARQAAAASAAPRAGGGPVAVEVAAVEVAPAETTVTAVGTLRSNESSILRPEVSGRVTRIQFEEGAAVERGEILVKLDDDVETAELKRAEAALQLARANLERARELRRTNVGTQRALDEAQAESLRTEAELALAEAHLAKRWIKAAFDARAGLRLFSLGDYVNVGQDLVNLEQIDPLKLDFRVPEILLPALHQGQRITFTVDAFPGELFTGEVYAINPLIDEAGRSVVIRAKVANPGGELRPGLFARVTLSLAERAEALWIPEEALFPQGEKQFVFRLLPQGKDEPPVARLSEVRLGKRLPGRVEIVEGLAQTDTVVSGGVTKIRDGVAVQPIAIDAPGTEPVTNDRTGPVAQIGRAHAAPLE
jgi:membrane fusion protein, multidrug efflux system